MSNLSYYQKEDLANDALRVCRHISVPIVYIIEKPIQSVSDLTDEDIRRLELFMEIEINLIVSNKELLWFMNIENRYPFDGKTPWQYWKDNKDNKATLYKLYIFTSAMKAEKIIEKAKKLEQSEA